LEKPKILYRHLDYDDVDALGEAVKDWSLEFQQLERGSFQGRITQAGQNGWIAGRAELSLATEQIGMAPPGVRTVVIPGTGESTFRWRNHDVDGGNLMIFPECGDLHAVGNRGFHILTFSFEQEDLTSAFRGLGFPESDNILDRAEVLRLNPKFLNRFRRLLSGIISSGAGSENMAILDPNPIQVLASVLADSSNRAMRRVLRLRERIFAEALKVLRTDKSGLIPISQLARQLQVSQRTLDAAFLGGLGVTPAAYRKVLRLNGVHRMLRNPGSTDIRVKDVARHFGFTHLSQFAKDYHAHFGILPSVTLQDGFKPRSS